MKKILALILAVATVFCFASCGKQETKEADVKTSAPAADTGNKDSDADYIVNKGTLVIGVTDYEPMNYKENGEWTGFDTEFAQAVAEKLGVKAEFKEIEWDNKIMELNSKALDSVWNGMTLTDEVKNGMECSKPYVINAQVVVMAKDKVDNYKEVSDLKDLSFVAEAGSAGEKAITEAGYECTAVQTQADALMEVSAGAADACVIDITMAKAMTGEGTSYASLKEGIALTSEEYGIGFRKGSDMAEKVNQIIDEFKADGTLEALAKKYDLTLAE